MNAESEIPDDDELLAQMETRQEFAAYVRQLSQEIRDNPGVWENSTLADFLEAASAFADSMDGWYLNQKLEIPAVPEWRTFAMILSAARIYE